MNNEDLRAEVKEILLKQLHLLQEESSSDKSRLEDYSNAMAKIAELLVQTTTV